jgi:AraC-like DNA-binding protein
VQALRQAVLDYAARHRNPHGWAMPPVPGLRLRYVDKPGGEQHEVAHPVVIIVLQGGKRMVIGDEERVIRAGETAIISADLPLFSCVEDATPEAPYLAMGINIEVATLAEIATHASAAGHAGTQAASQFDTDHAERATLECAMRLVQLCDRADAVPLLHGGIMRELHYWLLSGPHGRNLRALCDPASHASRLAGAVALLRSEYRSRLPVERLAATAGMSVSAFHTHFKRLLSLSPGQYQKRLRLLEARRLMLETGLSASGAAFRVGYESVPQFTRDYARLFKAPPKRDMLRMRARPSDGDEARRPMPPDRATAGADIPATDNAAG